MFQKYFQFLDPRPFKSFSRTIGKSLNSIFDNTEVTQLMHALIFRILHFTKLISLMYASYGFFNSCQHNNVKNSKALLSENGKE